MAGPIADLISENIIPYISTRGRYTSQNVPVLGKEICNKRSSLIKPGDGQWKIFSISDKSALKF